MALVLQPWELEAQIKGAEARGAKAERERLAELLTSGPPHDHDRLDKRSAEWIRSQGEDK